MKRRKNFNTEEKYVRKEESCAILKCVFLIFLGEQYLLREKENLACIQCIIVTFILDVYLSGIVMKSQNF